MALPSSQGREADNPGNGHEPAPGQPDRAWEDLYREKWRWDKVSWGSHCVDCYPSNCSYRV